MLVYSSSHTEKFLVKFLVGFGERLIEFFICDEEILKNQGIQMRECGTIKWSENSRTEQTSSIKLELSDYNIAKALKSRIL